MKETRFYQKALNLSLLDGKKMKAALDGRIAAIPAVTREKRSFSYRKFGLVAAACLLLFATAVMAIPSARAEVLSWLGIISRPQDYLTAEPSERPAIPALDSMIATAKPEDTQVNVTLIDRDGSRAVNSEGALKVAELLNRDVRITLGDTNAGWNWGNGHVSGIHYTQVASPNVTWEEAVKDDIGLDIVIFHNRFSLTVDYSCWCSPTGPECPASWIRPKRMRSRPIGRRWKPKTSTGTICSRKSYLRSTV